MTLPTYAHSNEPNGDIPEDNEIPDSKPIAFHLGHYEINSPVDAIPKQNKRAFVEDSDDDDDSEPWQKTYQERYSSYYQDAGLPRDSHTVSTVFEQLRDHHNLSGANMFGPFGTKNNWELAKFLMTHLSQGDTERFLKLEKVGFLCLFSIFA
jgi:hypothetical protein